MEFGATTYQERQYAITSGSYKTNCGPIAISRAFCMPLEQATELCLKHGYKKSGVGRGFAVDEMDKLCKILNPNTEHFSGRFIHVCKVNPINTIMKHGQTCGFCKLQPLPRKRNIIDKFQTLTTFCQTNRTGIYICHVNCHWVTVKNGVIVDPNWHRVGRVVDKRKVIQYWKVG